MWINYKTNTEFMKDMKHYYANGRDYYYSGIFFIPGFKEGIESIKELDKQYSESNKLDFIQYMGSYNIVIKEDEEYIFFSSNSISSGLYYNGEIVSNNVLDIVKHSSSFAFDEKGISQYIMYGKVFFDKTYIKDAYITSNQCFYRIKNNIIEKLSKNIGTLEDEEKGISPEIFSNYLSIALQDKKSVLSLTGGFDSRFVLSMFLKKCPIFASICGSDITHEDFVISKSVAEAARVPYKAEVVEKPTITDDYIKEVFVSRGGYHYLINESVFRLNEYIDRKKSEGFECLITGDSGIFHKSDEWTQYFPFYNLPFTNTKRDYRNLILCNKKMLPMSDRLKVLFEKNREEILLYLNENKKNCNTKSFDWFSWYLSRKASYMPLYNGQSMLIDSYPPLLEYRLVVNSYNLKRRKRIMAWQMREFISSVDKAVSEIPTAIGATASTDLKLVLKDCLICFVDVFKSAKRFISRFIKLGKKEKSHNATTWSCEKEIRGLKLSEQAVDFGIENDWIEAKLTVNDVPYDLLVKLIELFLLKTYR